MLSTAFTACQRNKSATSSTHRMYEHALTVSEDADDHTPVGFTVPPVGRQLSIDVRHFHQHITDHTDNTHTAWPAHLYSIYIYDMLPLRQSSITIPTTNFQFLVYIAQRAQMRLIPAYQVCVSITLVNLAILTEHITSQFDV